IKPEKREALSAVCHADGTGRLHTVKRSQNALYYDLIKAFAARTGTPVLLNTSFNENEPIVDTPAQAVHCFTRTDIDVLVVGPFIAVKQREKEKAESRKQKTDFEGPFGDWRSQIWNLSDARGDLPIPFPAFALS